MRTETLQRDFEKVLPRIRTHAEVVFRSVRCPQTREDFVAEVIALAWTWWRRLRSKGKKPQHFVSALATFAVRAARSGRRLCGQEKSKDVLSRRAQQHCGFTVSSLPSSSTLAANPFSEALTDNTRTPVDEQAAFRLDFPAWLATYDERRQKMIEAMGQGERTQDLATLFRVSPARISQLRSEFQASWHAFVGNC